MSLKQVNTTLDLELVTVNPEYESLIPPLTKEEYHKLKDSIRLNGLWEPITVNQRNVILDGHNRFKVCKELSVMPRFSIRVFEDPLDEKLYVIDSNLIRRQLPILSKTEVGIKRESIEAERAKQRQESTRFGGVQMNTAIEDYGKARDAAAKAVGLSPTTYHRAKTVLERASPELLQRVRDGKTSVSYAYKTINLAEKHRKTPPMPTEEYNVIYADPPWEYDIMTRGAPDEHYLTMKLEDICKLQIPANENAILFLWATNPKLIEALEVVKAWGFEYKTNLAWVKDKIGNGYYVRGQHELLLIAKRGEIPPPMEANRPPSILHSPSTEHSRKPDEVYEIIEKMYPTGKYLELFARVTRPKWASWGNEL